MYLFIYLYIYLYMCVYIYIHTYLYIYIYLHQTYMHTYGWPFFPFFVKTQVLVYPTNTPLYRHISAHRHRCGSTQCTSPLMYVSCFLVVVIVFFFFFYNFDLSSYPRCSLKVPCAPKWFDFEIPPIKTTNLLVETRSCTWAKRIHP